MNTNDFLLELGTEELPAQTLHYLSQALKQNFIDALQVAQLSYQSIQVFATPRRLAILIEALNEQQPDQLVERKGPSLKAAFDEAGNPTKACLGFAKSCGVTPEELQREETAQGTWLMFRQQKSGQTAVELLPAITDKAIKQLPIPKPMRWGNSGVQFIRPVHWVVMLYGTTIIETTLFNIKASNISCGHRFHAPQAISIDEPKNYLTALKQSKVIADFAERQALIRQQIEQLARQQKATAVIDSDLLNEVTSLVEWPQALLGSFDKDFLQVPQEALITSMQTHQKTFALMDKQGKLLPCFIAIANIESKQPERVAAGNERVICARLSDAAFFYTTDKKQKLSDRLNQLEKITFQQNLGSLYDKAQRIEKLAGEISSSLQADVDQARRAGLLAKADLTTEMVGEFPELQGIIGEYYARHDDEPESVSAAIREHYLPRFAGDELPSSALAASVALADRLDTLVGIFGINKQPTGDKDPFALRRAALGVVRILVEKEYCLSLDALLEKAKQGFVDKLTNVDVVEQVKTFIVERLKIWCVEKVGSVDSVHAVLASDNDNPFDVYQRINALQVFKKLPEAQALAAANKRVGNILKKQMTTNEVVKSELLQEHAEQQLAQAIDKVAEQIKPLLADRQYAETLSKLATLQPDVDRFFDEVMVMAEDEKLRQNRLSLLSHLRNQFIRIADISLLQY